MPNEADAIKFVDKINVEMRAISASMHQNHNVIDSKNRSQCRLHYNNILQYVNKYEQIKKRMSDFDRNMMMGVTVDIWNGEHDGLIVWEEYLRRVLPLLNIDINN